MANPTDASIDAAINQIAGDIPAARRELIRLLETNVPLQVPRQNSARGWTLKAPGGLYTSAPANLVDVPVDSIIVAISARRGNLGVRNFKTLALCEISYIAGALPVAEEVNDDAWRMGALIAGILAGEADTDNPVMLHWKDPAGLTVWAELVPSEAGISPLIDDQVYGVTVSYEMLQYPSANATT